MTTDEIKQKVTDYANGYGIDPNIALAQLARESINFRSDVVFGPTTGGDGERGIGQFLPGTWASYGYGSFDNAFDLDYNLTAWGNYMTHLLGLFGGDYEKALQGYNGGEGHVQRGDVSGMAQDYASSILAQAGAQADTTTGDLGTIIVTPGGYEQTPSWLKWAGLGVLGLIIWYAMSD